MKEYFVWLAKFVTVILFIFIFVPLTIGVLAGIGAMVSGADMSSSKNSVGVVELDGVIMKSSDVIEKIKTFVKNDSIKGIVLKIDSPGGAVGPSQEIYDAVKEFQKVAPSKPIVSSMGAVAASGGLYAALSSQKIFANPGTITGSIGVIMEVPNFTKVADWAGVDIVTIKSGKLKDVGNSFREMTPEEKEFLQATVQEVQNGFVNAVAEGRKLSRDKVLSFADGRPIIGSQAKELGLIDDFGGVYDAARSIFELRGEPLEETELPNLIYSKDKFQELKEAFQSAISHIEMFTQSGPKLMFIMR